MDREKTSILEQLINIIPGQGFNIETLSLASQNAGLPSNYWEIIFPNGIKEASYDLERFFDQLMINQLSLIQPPIKTHHKVITALQYRIKLVPQAVALKLCFFYAMPNNYSTAITNSWASCNKIWCYANDRSTDFNYYTKRALLMAAYLPSIAYYIKDSSDNYHKTDYFITKIIEKILNAAKLKQKIKSKKLDDIPIVRFFL
ncbi:COQ9 family protein [Orientia chuto str. Dubai]|uniref:COQ9 family protein n=1 Tax=Orientia chuto str. Dubai TaxID=1359168 RepID=A0A0F3MRL3_9RICK|nr:COQ9 family protein [Candidatus Orientia mediorientalis]KJV57239.1 COQ9 family protein [Orientia chuto str. Dubai]